MSDTDDTDILLLISPNFFLEHSGSEDSLLESSRTVVHKPPSCTSQVIGKLVTQVHCLENRLESLELSTSSDFSSRNAKLYGNRSLDFSIDSHSIDKKSYTFPRLKKRKLAPKRHKRRELSFASLESTSSCANVPSLTLEDDYFKKPVISDFQMDGDVSSIVSTPSKKNDKLLLNEIDEFLHNVETYESPESCHKAPEASLCTENVIRATGDYMTQKFDAKDTHDDRLKAVTSSILNKYIYLADNESESKADAKKDAISNPIPSTSSGEIKSPVYRKLNFMEMKDVQPTSTPKRNQLTSRLYQDRFRPSTNKVYDRASRVLEQYKSKNNEDTVNTSLLECTKNEYKYCNKPYVDRTSESQKKYIESIDTELLSLSDLWGGKGDKAESGKLEEERLKREHCEALIQELQKKLLSQQEKLAVAMRVDRAKDTAISKLRQAWLEVTGNVDKTELRYKAAHDKMVAEVDKHKSAACDAQKKIEHFEAELYKTLDLAHDYQEKCKRLTKEKQEMDNKIQEITNEKDLVINNKDIEIVSMKENYDTVLRLNKQSHDCIKNLEGALEKEKQEHQLTQGKLLELVSKTTNINEETNLLIQERDLQRERVNEERARGQMLEKQLSEKDGLIAALQKREDTLENDLLEARKMFEFQKNELKCHYQKQLEDAVMSKLQEFQLQLDHAEKDMENDARVKETNILEGYNKQIAKLQEQHKLEINVLEEKHREEMKLYRLQLAQASENITMLENKVDSYRRRRGQLASQLHQVMQTQWRQALNILTQTNAHSQDVTIASTPLGEAYSVPKVPPSTMPAFMEQPNTMRNFDSDRLSEKLFNFEGLSDSELQHYVKSFLTKPPSVLEASAQLDMRENEEPTSDQPKYKQRRSQNKPPWKS